MHAIIAMTTECIQSSSSYELLYTHTEETGLIMAIYVYTGVSSETVGGTAGGIVLVLVILLCGFGTGVVAVYVLRQRKRIKQSKELECSYYKLIINIPLYCKKTKSIQSKSAW